MTTTEQSWDLNADVVVLGSGGAALVAALAAKDHGADEVLILEKSGMVGGTTAMSGGMLWIPLNYHSLEAGVEDSAPRVNEHAQVLDWDNQTIPGLYVGSNTMAAVTAGVYGGAGGTIGPGMTFGFIGGRHAAQKG